MKVFIAFLLSLLIMAVIFSRVNLAEFRAFVTQMNPGLFVAALLLFIPQVGLTAYRWRILIEEKARIGLWESTKLVLSANALNILLPSRVGDLSKGYFVSQREQMDLKRGMNVVFFEKYIDLASLGLVTLVGILAVRQWDQPTLLGLGFSLSLLGIFPILYAVDLQSFLERPFFERSKVLSKIRNFAKDTQDYLNEVKKKPRKLLGILALSIFLWFLHLLQFYMIFLALHSQVSPFHVFRLVPLAILVGLVPLTIAGMGTRDSAMIYFFSPYEKVSLIVGVGLFASLRYLIPGALGLPFLNQYVVREKKGQ